MVRYSIKSKEENLFISIIPKEIKDNDNVKLAVALRDLFPQSSDIYNEVSKVFDINGMVERGFLVTERTLIEEMVRKILTKLDTEGERFKSIFCLATTKDVFYNNSFADEDDIILGISSKGGEMILSLNSRFDIIAYKDQPEIAYELKI